MQALTIYHWLLAPDQIFAAHRAVSQTGGPSNYSVPANTSGSPKVSPSKTPTGRLSPISMSPNAYTQDGDENVRRYRLFFFTAAGSA